VRRWLCVLLMLFASGDLLAVFAQDTTIHSGFAVVTLDAGNLAGLIATESLKNATSLEFNQAIVAPSVLVTSASILAPLGPSGGNTTALAITNPTLGSGGVNLILTDGVGNVVLNTVIVLGPLGHFSRFLNELFPAEPPAFPAPLLLTISSEIPIAILALNFHGADFAPLPMTSLSSPIPLGTPSLVFSQIATGGGWSTEIAVGNTSAGTQQIRIDFFGADGVHRNSVSDIVIPSRGVFFISTAQVQTLN
jgi:hypothetical protein